MTEDKLKAAGMVKCDACSRWMYRDEGTPCPFCPEPEADRCAACNGPTDDAGRTFMTKDGTLSTACGESRQITAASVRERGAEGTR